jgi:hypothetical protein
MPRKSESGESKRRAESDKPRKARTPRKRVSRAGTEPSAVESPDERWQRIALDAYYRAERRGFAPGGELDDWLAAEQQTD